jgi:hypothetical protein
MERAPMGESIRPDVFELICQRPDEASLCTLAPDSTTNAQLQQQPQSEDAATNGKSQDEAPANYQKKITPWSTVDVEEELVR